MVELPQVFGIPRVTQFSPFFVLENISSSSKNLGEAIRPFPIRPKDTLGGLLRVLENLAKNQIVDGEASARDLGVEKLCHAMSVRGLPNLSLFPRLFK